MCPVIEGADLTTVETDRKPLDEQEVLVTITSADFDDAKKNIIIKQRIDEAKGNTNGNKEWWDYVNIKKNDGDTNDIGLTTIKRYLEAVYGKGSAEAQASPPDTDLLVGHQVRHYLVIDEFDRKDGTKGKKNKSKKIMKA